jgi:ribosomal protein S18 acetylase RimI-like enzyme
MTLTPETCTAVDLDALHQGMQEAFGDYYAPMGLSRGRFTFMLRQRGFDPALSRVVRAGERVLAFWLIATDPDACPGRAYVISAGTCLDHRGRGLAGELFRAVGTGLTEAGMTELRLEVGQGNTAAERLYAKLGFRPRRELLCYWLEAAPEPGPVDRRFTLRPVALSELRAAAAACQDWEPSWQNGFRSLERAGEDATVLGVFESEVLLGYGALFEPSGHLAQLAVKRGQRRRELGSAILAQLAARADAPGRLQIVNVDAGDEGSRRFFEAKGAQATVTQTEMTLTLVPGR